MKCLLVDDEPLALDLLEDNLKQVNYIQVAGRCPHRGRSAYLAAKRTVDLLFCDIQLPGLKRLQLVKSLVKSRW